MHILTINTVFARGNATSTGIKKLWCCDVLQKITLNAANAPQTKRDGKGPLTGGINFGTLLTERANKFEHKDLLVIPGEDVRNTFIEVQVCFYCTVIFFLILLQKKVDAFATGLHELHIVAGDSFVAALPDTSQNVRSFVKMFTLNAFLAVSSIGHNTSWYNLHSLLSYCSIGQHIVRTTHFCSQEINLFKGVQ